MLSSRYAKMLCRLAEHPFILPCRQGSTTLDSVVYNDSTIMSKKQLYYIFTAKIVRLQHFCHIHSFRSKVLFLWLLRGNFRPGTRQKWLDFQPWSSYYTTAIRGRNRPAAERSWAIVLYHINTTDRFGTHGNSGHKSDEKCHNLCKMH